ncbi:MAG: dihydroorotase [Alphaproteobacteria bacterium]|nr:dihydroorotase [Alphaproteobacteria bacterium]
MRLTLPRPDDWHVHLRDGEMLRTVLPYTAQVFARAIVMPNLKPPVTTTARAKAYRDEILAALPKGIDFTPLMTLYLTDTTDADDVAHGHSEGIVTAVKLYPAHATTNSEHGVTDMKKIRPVLERMQKIGMPFLVHGEVTDPDVDTFDREAVFIDKILKPLCKDFPELKIVFEHITTQEATDYVTAEGKTGRVAATITAHHLLINRNAMFTGGLRPHYYCLPVAKREKHRQALVKAATSGMPMFFLGTDTAPHKQTDKESACGCAGVFSAPNALEWYAQVFDEAGKLANLEGFASRFGPAFYDLPVNKDLISLEKQKQPEGEIKPILTGNGGQIVPFASFSPLFWRRVTGA